MEPKCPTCLPEEVISLINRKMQEDLRFSWNIYGQDDNSTIVLKWKKPWTAPAKPNNLPPSQGHKTKAGKPPSRKARDKKRWVKYNDDKKHYSSLSKGSTAITGNDGNSHCLPMQCANEVSQCVRNANVHGSGRLESTRNSHSKTYTDGNVEGQYVGQLDGPCKQSQLLHGDTSTEPKLDQTSAMSVSLSNLHRELEEFTSNASDVEQHTRPVFYRKYLPVEHDGPNPLRTNFTFDSIGMDSKHGYMIGLHQGHIIRYDIDDHSFVACYFGDKYRHWYKLLDQLDQINCNRYKEIIYSMTQHLIDNYEDFALDHCRHSVS
jgi:hypothetical protein